MRLYIKDEKLAICKHRLKGNRLSLSPYRLSLLLFKILNVVQSLKSRHIKYGSFENLDVLLTIPFISIAAKC